MSIHAASPITVVIAEFEDLVAYGLRALLGEDPNMEILTHDVPMNALEAAVAEHEPDVVVVNFAALRSPIEIHQLHEAQPEARLVVLANRPSPAEANQLLAFGATACLSKETQKRDVLTAIHLASRGLHVLPRADREITAERSGPDLLTTREADVLELLQAGRSNAEIAAQLHVGVETVRTHARNIYRKLGVTNRRELSAPGTILPPRR